MTDALEELESLLPDLPQALERRSLGESLARVGLLLNDINASAQRLSDICEIAQTIGVEEVPELVDKLDDLIHDAGDLASMLMSANDPVSLRQVEHDFPKFKTAISGTFTAIKQRWRTQVARDYKPFVSLGRLLSKIDHGSSLGARMVALGEEADASLLLAQADQFKLALKRLIETRARLEQEKTTFTAGEEVDLFLSDLAQNQARLRSVTPDVLRWIADHDALDLFEVRPIA